MNDLKKIYAKFGKNTVLIPDQYGKKIPLYKGWQKVTLFDSKQESYQADLQKNNVSVRFDGNLCSIDIDDDEEIEPFLDLNPGLRDTLITKGQRGVQIWVRCEEDPWLAKKGFSSWYPTKKLNHTQKKIKKVITNKETGEEEERLLPKAWGEWRSGSGSKSTVAGKHPSGVEYQWLNNNGILKVFFRDIRWPDYVTTPWMDEVWAEMIKIYGNPYSTNEKGQVAGMLEHFWAAKFAWEHGILYEADEDRFFLYDKHTGLWKRTNEEEIKVLVSQDMRRSSEDKKLADIGSNKFRGSSKLSAVISFLKGEVSERGIFAHRRGMVHCRNLMMDLASGKAYAFSPRFYSRNQIPVDYDPQAECPVFLNELLLSALSEEDVVMLQQYAGLLLLGRNDCQVVMILTGQAGGGKSTVVKVMQEMVGLENVAQLRTEQLNERFELYSFIGKTLLSGVDVPGNFLMRRGAYVIKGLTGGDMMQAEAKSARDFITIEGNYNCLITCNSRLRLNLDSDAEAWRRRLRIISYTRPKPEKPKKDFARWLVENEGPGILNWMIAGAHMILRGNNVDQNVAQQARVDSLLEESDSVRSFVRRRVAIEKGSDVTTEELSKAYVKYCDDQGWDAIPDGALQRELPNVMLSLYRQSRRNDIKREGTSRRGWKGLKICEHDEPDEEL